MSYLTGLYYRSWSLVYGIWSFGYFLHKKMRSSNYKGVLMRDVILFRFIVGWFIFILFLNVVEVLTNLVAVALCPFEKSIID